MYTMQQPLPAEYLSLSEEEMDRRIRKVKEDLGSRLLILGHHYQRDEVVRYADYRGDSLRLSQLAAQAEAEYIVFCGVHFMAETADILTVPEQKVILPDLGAGCPMADMADIEDVERCWEQLVAQYDEEFVPVTYVNSSAEVKAFCGRHGGLTCTSSNAMKILKTLFSQGKRILFLPDEHLGRNSAMHLGLEEKDMFLWQREEWEMELPEAAPKIILWDGYCGVHQRFTPAHVDYVRVKYPGVTVIVHPECSHVVVEKADLDGSTDFIIRQITGAPEGSIWAVGTEINLVSRLAKENPDKKIVSLNENTCLCVMMSRISQPHLLWALENLAQGNVVNQITVKPEIAKEAIVALDRMLEMSK
ncbi:quinolinate synthetase complex, A subunit [Desulfitobacterium hafniense DCB-2]|nr:quinolinate synthase NadA [Desulfitobacterium hafniense]ACL18980.1 quinolinate synthetase complex, A subunit [Desulfitobacterium hafniense DCB-2]MEA5025081.1 quinolinate synthase NadA [Desulfitobacterium hafniense]